MRIGVPNEFELPEHRVGLLPGVLAEPVRAGHAESAEADPDAGSGFEDDYTKVPMSEVADRMATPVATQYLQMNAGGRRAVYGDVSMDRGDLLAGQGLKQASVHRAELTIGLHVQDARMTDEAVECHDDFARMAYGGARR